MIKIDLSAMKKENIEANVLPIESEQISEIKEISPIKTKKKMSLNSLISGEQNVLENEYNQEKIEKTEELEAPKSVIFEEIVESQVSDVSIKEIDKTAELSEKKEEIQEKGFEISDGNTIGRLIVETKKEEIFGNYVSSFEKEMQALKKKNEKKESKESKVETKKEEIKKETRKNENIGIEIDYKNINLDEIIDKIEVKEEIKKEKIKLNLDFLKIFSKRNSIVLASILVLSVFVYVFGFTNFTKYVKTSILENKKINFDFLLPQKKESINLDTKTPALPDENINYETNHKEVKEKLIKYFKNKQNKSIIE